jgi:mannose-6-phosphate isomerase-like protein (cupin superfamily)
MPKKHHVIPIEEADTGVLYGGKGKFRILIDEKMCGAKNYSMLLNTQPSGAVGKPHKHDDAEHSWFILEGTGKVMLEDEIYAIGPNMTVYIPPGVMHGIEADEGSTLKYIVIYSPPGPEQNLRESGATAFDRRS